MLIHWNEIEARERAARLRKAGFDPLINSVPGAGLKRVREEQPDAIVIDLSRLPSHGREIAVSLRQSKSTRNIPIVFIGGESDKVERTREILPDALYAEWPRIKTAVRDAIENPPAAPAVLKALAGYSGTPLPKKLGIKPGAAVALINSPDAFERTLGPLPDGVELRDDVRGRSDLVVLFASRLADIYDQFPRAERSLVECGKLWIAWPKQASGVRTDITQSAVREFGLAAGWVDYKVCAIDETWSGLAFSRRRPANRAAR